MRVKDGAEILDVGGEGSRLLRGEGLGGTGETGARGETRMVVHQVQSSSQLQQATRWTDCKVNNSENDTRSVCVIAEFVAVPWVWTPAGSPSRRCTCCRGERSWRPGRSRPCHRASQPRWCRSVAESQENITLKVIIYCSLIIFYTQQTYLLNVAFVLFSLQTNKQTSFDVTWN